MTDTDVGTPQQGCSPEDSLEPEHEPQPKKSHKPDGIDDCRKKLRKDARAIEILNRLTDRGATLVLDAVSILTKAQTAHDSRVYQLFLRDILRQAGPGFVVLCAASLGKQRVAKLPTDDRVELVLYIKDNKTDLDCPALELLAEEYQIHSANDPRLAQVAGRSRKRIYGEEKQLSRKRDSPQEEAEAGDVEEPGSTAFAGVET